MKHFSLLFLFIIFLSCESPFATKPTEGDVFEVTQDYNGEKIYHPTAVTIEWSNITIKNFKEFLVERSITIGDSTVWEERARILDSLSTVYTDTIDDDATFQYRVQIVDKDDQFIVAHSEPLIVPNVQALRVPNDYENPQNAFDSKFIDDGDTVKIYPGLYQGHFEFMDKDAVIRAITIPEITLFGADVGLGSVVKMNRGTLEGLTIIGGYALSGGGIFAEGTAVIKNCIIRRNRAVINETANIQIYPNGMGGGIYLKEDAKLISCRITRNHSQREGGGILTDGNNEILNCTIDNNNIYSAYVGATYSGAGLHQEGGVLVMRNTKFKRNNTQGFGAAINSKAVIEVTNCLFEKNKSGGGGGFIVGNTSRADIMNCVFFGNRTFSSTYSGAIVNFGNVSILNTVVWKNGGEIDYRLYPRSATYTDSDEFRVQFGTGNINTDPFFENPSNGNFHLQSDSPCINAGNTDSIYNNSNGSRNDMGIYGGPYGDDW